MLGSSLTCFSLAAAVMASAVPPNFSWVVPDKLAGLAMPRLPAHYQYMHEHGIRHLVSLSERSPPYHDTCPGIQVHRLRIPDFCPPSVEQIQRFLQIVEDANAKGEVRPSQGLAHMHRRPARQQGGCSGAAPPVSKQHDLSCHDYVGCSCPLCICTIRDLGAISLLPQWCMRSGNT